jgi:hypothetical protein
MPKNVGYSGVFAVLPALQGAQEREPVKGKRKLLGATMKQIKKKQNDVRGVSAQIRQIK